jgi:hypothetical protein
LARSVAQPLAEGDLALGWHHRHVDPSELRASNADREQVAQRLRGALDEGRLNLHEYDERLRQTYSARTYAELNALMTDLPGPVPGQPARIVPATPGAPVPGPDGRYPGATGRWIALHWAPWVGPVLICTAIWGISSIATGHLIYFWPFWVAVPWGIMLLVGMVRGLAGGEPQRFAARQVRRAAEREIRHARRGR